MIKIDVKKDYLLQFPDFFDRLRYNESFDWQCADCGQQHHETEYRNFQRRKIKCVCQANQQRIAEMNEALAQVNYVFLYKEPQAYEVSKNGKIECKKKILVQCLKCGKISYEFYHNLVRQHKRCNCNETKAFTRDLTTQEFVNKWPDFNRQNFELVTGEQYKNRNSKYKVRCKNCGHVDERWGISLIDDIIGCKYCNQGSKHELFIAMLLDKLGINYIREYIVTYHSQYHRFDFFIPDLKIVIEYNGLQHYQPVALFGGEEQFLLRQKKDQEKVNYCQENNIRLIIFRYDQSNKEIEKQIGLIFND